MYRKLSFAALAVVLAIGLVGCHDDYTLTAPNGTVYLEVTANGVQVFRIYTIGSWNAVRRDPLKEGDTVFPPDLLDIAVTFHGRGEKEITQPVTARILFRFEDGFEYRSEALVFGPFLGSQFTVATQVLVGDFMTQVSRFGQRVQMVIEFDNWQSFNIVGFYVGNTVLE